MLRLRITDNGSGLIVGDTGGHKTRPYGSIQIRANDYSPLRDKIGIIREIHTYGTQTPIAEKGASAQHTGLGKKLIFEAEKIAKTEFGVKKIAAISGVGARPYWRKNGYKLKESYMVKSLR